MTDKHEAIVDLTVSSAAWTFNRLSRSAHLSLVAGCRCVVLCAQQVYKDETTERKRLDSYFDAVDTVSTLCSLVSIAYIGAGLLTDSLLLSLSALQENRRIDKELRDLTVCLCCSLVSLL